MKKCFFEKLSLFIMAMFLSVIITESCPINTQVAFAATPNLIIHCKKPADWSKVNIYYYSNNTTVPSWPGTGMTSEGSDWYTYTITGLSDANVIFNDGSGIQVPGAGKPGFAVTTESWYKDGQMYTQNPEQVMIKSIAINSSSSATIGESIVLTSIVTYSDGSEKQEDLNWSISDSTLADLSTNSGKSVSVTALKKGSVTVTASKGMLTTQKTINISEISKNSIKVYFQSPWSTAKIYYWSTVPSVPPISWPGVDMASEGNGWYSYIFNGATSTNLIFNNGSGSKTSDLSRSSGIWYYSNNVWSDKDPRIDTTVPIITASPDSGKIGGTSLEVILTVNDNVDTNPKIYYTIDGTDPIVGDNLYTGSIKITKDTTIKAIAIDNSNNKSKIYTFSYLLGQDVIPPTVTANVPAGRYATAKDVILTVSDNKDSTPKLYFTTNGTAPYINDNYLYKGQAIHVDKFTHIYTITVDEAGNTTENHFIYNIGNTPDNVDFRKETIYFVITPRFYDGDPSNNVHGWDDAQAKNPDTDPAWRGDFLGLTEKLDYIKALGFSAIWVTPPVKNASGYDYHGYHAINFNEIDPRYKTRYDASAEEAYQKFIIAAHSKGLKVIQDIVLNHTSNFGEENLFPLFNRVAPTSLNDTAASSLKNILSPLLPSNYDTLTPALQYSTRINAMKEDSNDPNHIYHHEKSLSWESYSVQTGQIAGDCVDLNTENPTVSKYLVDSYKKYIDMGVDSFRIDTVKHVSRLTFNNEFIPQLKAAGGEGFYMFGEACTRVREVWNHDTPAISVPFYTWKESKNYPWGDRVTNEASTLQNYNDNSSTVGQPTSTNAILNGNTYHIPDYSKKSGLDVIDFPMHWNFANARDAFRVAIDGDSAYNDATWNVTYVDSHDYAPDGAPENQRFSLGQDVWAENLSLIFTFRGIPTILYGSEIEFQKGKPIDVGPNAPLSETGRAYFGDKIQGNVQTTDYGVYSNATGTMADTLNYPLAQHIIRLNRIRRAVPALQMGEYSVQNVTGDGMSFKRRYTDVSSGVDSFALITISGNATFTNIPNGKYVDAVTGQIINVTNGTLKAACSGKGNLRVFVLDEPNNSAPGKIGTDTKYLY
ncbi:cyclomaltodextrin glucanotransferase precursor [Clostridium puniceum]|uniref:Cyclomaltodextrin glucanotransferase n=1 Tax=Clostridium puniceum TaxID=29367 RepID=A0A1S8T9N8_9CLOT|nr:alpha-amylase family glycosyl hydrolase [Clostridium puniceum]OOM74392.1 cyclomaltodextrin glucanotransferase precursor [Clostridium puniceum]